MALYLNEEDVRGILSVAKEKSERAMQSMNYEISTPTFFAPKQDLLHSTLIHGLLEGKKTVHDAIKQSYTSAYGLLQNVVYLNTEGEKPKLLTKTEMQTVVQKLFRDTGGESYSRIYENFVRPVLLDNESAEEGSSTSLPGHNRNVFLYLTQIAMAAVRNRNARRNHLPSTLFVLFQREAMNLPDDMATVQNAINEEAKRRETYANPRHVSDYQRVICLMPSTFNIEVKIKGGRRSYIKVHTISFVVWSWKFGSADIPSVTIYYAIMESNEDLKVENPKKIHIRVRFHLMDIVIKAFLGLDEKMEEGEEDSSILGMSPIKPKTSAKLTYEVIRSKNNASLLQALFGVPKTQPDDVTVPPRDGVLKPVYTFNTGINVVNCSNKDGHGGPFDLFSLFFMLESFPMHYGPTSIDRFRKKILHQHIEQMSSKEVNKENRYTSPVDHFRAQLFSAATSADGPLLDLTEAESFRKMPSWMLSFVYGRKETISGVAAMQGMEVTTKEKTVEDIERAVKGRKRRETLERKQYPTLEDFSNTIYRNQKAPDDPVTTEYLENQDIIRINLVGKEDESYQRAETSGEEERERMIGIFWNNFHLLKKYLLRKSNISTHKRLSFLAALLDAISSVQNGPEETWRLFQGDEETAKRNGYYWMEKEHGSRSKLLINALKDEDSRRTDVNAWSLFHASKHFHSPEREKTSTVEEDEEPLDIRRIGPAKVDPFLEYLEKYVREYYLERLTLPSQIKMVTDAVESITKAFNGKTEDLRRHRNKIMKTEEPIFGKNMRNYREEGGQTTIVISETSSSVASFFEDDEEESTETVEESTETVEEGTSIGNVKEEDEEKRKWILNQFFGEIHYRITKQNLSSYGRLETIRELIWALLPTRIDDEEYKHYTLVLELNERFDPKESEKEKEEELTEDSLEDKMKNTPEKITLRMLEDRKPFSTVSKEAVENYLEWLIGPSGTNGGSIRPFIEKLGGFPLDEIYEKLNIIVNEPARQPQTRKGWLKEEKIFPNPEVEIIEEKGRFSVRRRFDERKKRRREKKGKSV
jgi:hypothetical protein